MKRMFALSFLIVLLLGGATIMAAEDTVAQSTRPGKSFYSSRTGTTPRPRPVIVTDTVVDPVLAPVETLTVTQAQVPVQAQPRAMMVPEFPHPPVPKTNPTAQTTVAKPPTLTDENDGVDDLSKRIDESLDRPLAGIDVSSTSTPSGTLKGAPMKSEPTKNTVSTPLSFGVPAVENIENPRNANEFSARFQQQNVNELTARLAKIQLERKNLDETLRLIDKIESPNFKVKTLVELAEYVSRDNNYKKEADRLYALALAGIDALAKGQPIDLSVEAAPIPKPTTSIAPKPSATAKRPATLIEEDEIEPAPKSVAPKSSTPPAARKPITLDDGDDAAEEMVAPKPATPKSSAPPAARKPITLDDGDDAAEEMVAPKPATPKSSAPSAARKPITLDDGDDAAEEVIAPKPAAPKSSAPPAARRAITLDDGEDDAEPILKATPKAAPKAAPKASTITLDDGDDIQEKEEVKAEPAPKPVRKPLPRKKIVLEEE